MSRSHVVIAVDGPAGSGKSSVSRQVAVRCALKYIDSGALYRSITWYLLEKYGSLRKGEKYIADLSGISIVQRFDEYGAAVTFVNGEDVSAKIRTESIAKSIGAVSDDPEIREFVNSLLRRWSENESIIMDGRDIGTVVFPSADLKIYLDASVDVRARRRFREYEDSGKNVDLNDIKNQIIQRDIEDQSRPVGALRRAENAVYLDTSGMDRDEVIDAVCDLIAPLLEKANAC